jgi:hypothetical protein
VRPIYPLLMMLGLRHAQVRHVLCVKCLEELYLEPCEDHALGKQPLQRRGVFARDLYNTRRLHSLLGYRSPTNPEEDRMRPRAPLAPLS